MQKLTLAATAALGVIAAVAAFGGPEAVAQENRDIVVTAPSIESGVGQAPTSWFRRIPSLIRPRISPDGTKLVVQMQDQGRAAVGWLDLSNPRAAPVFFAQMGELRNEGDRTVSNYNWVGNDVIVMTVITRENFFGQRGDTRRLVAYDLNTGRTTRLAWDGAGSDGGSILHTDHANGRILVNRNGFSNGASTGAEVISVDVRTGRYTMVQRPNLEVGGWFADPDGVVRLGVGYDRESGRRRIMYRSNASQVFRTIFNEADPSFTDAGLNPLWISPTSDFALVSDNRSGFARVYRVNLATNAYSAPVFESTGYDVDGVITNFGGRMPIGFAVTEARSRVQWTNPSYREMVSVLEERFGAGNVSIGSSNQNETVFVVYVSSGNLAGAYYLFNTETGDLRLIGNQWNHVAMTAMNPVSAFRYTASDGVEIEAILTMPRHRRQATNLPMVMIVHGGPFGPRDEIRYDSWAQAMAELGYVVVQPNYRGSGGYGRQFITMGRDNGFGLRMQDDLNDAVDHLARQGTIDPNRVCMMGWSYGGYASARAAQRDPDRYRCTIAGAGVYDLVMMREYDQNYLGSFGSNYLAKGAAELNSVSPARNPSGRWAPILIVHGLRDARVPIAQARTLVSRLRGAGKVEGQDFAYIEQRENTHNLDYDDVQNEWLEGARDWLARWNPAYIDSDSDRPVPVVPEGNRPARSN